MNGTGGYTGYNNFNYTNNNGSVYPSGSKSASASPGPMQRFKQNYAYELPAANFNSTNSHTRSWLEDYQYASNYNQGSRPGSVMSGYSACSVATNMSQLTIMTDDTEIKRSISFMTKYPSDPLQNNENYSTGQDISQITLQLIQQLCYDDIDPLNTITTIRGYAKSRSFDYVDESIVIQLFNALFRRLYNIWDTTPDSELINQLYQAIYNVIHASDRSIKFFLRYSASNPKIFDFMCRFLDPSKEYIRLVISIISTLVTTHEYAKPHIKILRRFPNIIDKFIGILQNKSKSTIKATLHTLGKLLRGNDNLRKEFYEKGGLHLLLNILNTENDEKILFQAANTLSVLISQYNDVTKEIIISFIESNGIHICAKHLGHGSPRFLNNLMECMTHIGDLQELANINLREPIKNVFKLLGVQDYELVKKAIGFLGNITARNHHNKVLLVDMNTPTALFRVITEVQAYSSCCKTDAQKKLYEDVIELGVWALYLIFNSYNIDNEKLKNDTINKAIDQVISYQSWNKTLLNVLELEPCKTKSYAAHVLITLFKTRENLILTFDKVFSTNKKYLICAVVYTLIEELFSFVQMCYNPNNNIRQIPMAYQCLRDSTQKEINDTVNLLLTRLISLMTLLIRSRLFGYMIITQLTTTHYDLIVKMQNICHPFPKACCELIFLSENLITHDPRFQQWGGFQEYVCWIQRYTNSTDQNVANYAHDFLIAIQRSRSTPMI